MKILEINKFYYLRGGSERHLFELSEALVRRGHTVIPFSMKDKRNLTTLSKNSHPVAALEKNSHPVAVFGAEDRKNQLNKFSDYFVDSVDLDRLSLRNILKIFYNRQAARQLEKLIKEERPDIAHLHNIQYQLTPVIIQTLKKHGIPIIQTLHSYNIICPNAKLYTEGSPCERCRGKKFYNCLIHKCARDSYAKSLLAMLEAYLNVNLLKRYDDVDVFIAPSNFMKEVSVRFGMPAEKIQVLHNFIDAEKFNAADSKIGDYLLYFGRLAEEKGVGMLIEAMKDLPSEKLKIVGEGPEAKNFQFFPPQRDPATAAAIFPATAGPRHGGGNFQLDSRVKLLGHKSGEELIRLIANAKAIIIPSRWPENMPYSLLEAMALGKTVVAARIGGLPELIEHGKNGFLFTAGSRESLNQQLQAINQVDLSALGACARETVLKLNALNYCERFEKIMADLLNTK